MRPLLARRAALLGAAALALPRAAGAAEANVGIDNFTFAPTPLTVPGGTKVTFTNRDDTPHTVTSAAQPPLFKSGPLDTGDSFARVFDTPGTFSYFCSLHPHMQGTVIVT